MDAITSTADILLVEDDDAEAELFTRMALSRAPECTVTRVSSGRQALDQLERHPLPDCIVLDLRLPGEDGIWVLEQLLGNAGWRTIPVIVFSGDLSRLGPASSQYPNVASSVRKPHTLEEYEATLLIVCAIVGATVSR